MKTLICHDQEINMMALKTGNRAMGGSRETNKQYNLFLQERLCY